MLKRILVCGLVLALCACNARATSPDDAPSTAVPAIPEGAETVAFERETTNSNSATRAEMDEGDTADKKPRYWGIKDGEPLTIMWEDLMPEGSEEALMREYQEFYAMLEKRYAANTTTLADADPYGAIAEGSEFDYMPQLGSYETVSDLDGEFVKIPGYVVPFDFNTKNRQSEFLFVPYMGACIHTPPPPPNQIIFIRADPAVRIKDIWTPYWIEGILQTEKNENDLGNTAYAMEMQSVEPYPIP